MDQQDRAAKNLRRFDEAALELQKPVATRVACKAQPREAVRTLIAFRVRVALNEHQSRAPRGVWHTRLRVRSRMHWRSPDLRTRRCARLQSDSDCSGSAH